MNRLGGYFRRGGLAIVIALLLPVQNAAACTACYGQSDSPLAQGMNWGILSLLAMIGVVLAGIAGFGFVLAKRASSINTESNGSTS